MLPDRVSNPGPLTYESGALPIALCGPAQTQRRHPHSQQLGSRIRTKPLSVVMYYKPCMNVWLKGKIQSTLVISKSKASSKTLRDIHTSTYQICSIEEKMI